MSSETAISMRELEAESVELLPSRETLCYAGGRHGGGSAVFQNGLVNLNNVSILDNSNVAIANIGSSVLQY